MSGGKRRSADGRGDALVDRERRSRGRRPAPAASGRRRDPLDPRPRRRVGAQPADERVERRGSARPPRSRPGRRRCGRCPSRPSSVARRQTNGRKPTPWTTPSTTIWRAAPASSVPAAGTRTPGSTDAAMRIGCPAPGATRMGRMARRWPADRPFVTVDSGRAPAPRRCTLARGARAARAAATVRRRSDEAPARAPASARHARLARRRRGDPPLRRGSRRRRRRPARDPAGALAGPAAPPGDRPRAPRPTEPIRRRRGPGRPGRCGGASTSWRPTSARSRRWSRRTIGW